MFLIRRKFNKANLQCLNLVCGSTIRTNNFASDSLDNPKKIQVPNRIHRSPTAILEALAATVGDDVTAAHYKYHDDPFLIPTSNVTKKTYAMALESGRRAAKWIKEEHRELFMHKNADPPIPAFFPKMVYTEDSEVDETCLRILIQNAEITDAVLVYDILKKKNIPIENTLKQSLLELICFYNNEEPDSKEFLEEYYIKLESATTKYRKTWKDGDIAEQIFKEIEPKTPQSYSAIIRGMCKYFQTERAYALFQEAMEKQIELDTKTFNALISITNFLKDTADLKWELVKDFLRQMNEMKLKPNLQTMNSCLSMICSIGNFRIARTYALRILSEFKKLEIEPSLATWYYILVIFCRERGPVSHVIVDILNQIEDKEFTIRDPKDIYFFVTAMDVCRNHLHDKTLAKRVNSLLHVGNNYDLIGDPNKEFIYYRHYFALLSQTEPINEFMKIYELLVPKAYIPEPGIMAEILKAVDISGAIELIPKLWSDMIIFEQAGRERLVQQILQIMCQNKPNPNIESQSGLTEKFGDIANQIFTRMEEQIEMSRLKTTDFTAKMLGDILQLLSDAGNWEAAQQVFNKLDKNQHLISGTASSESIEAYLQLTINEKSPSCAINCLEYAVENGYDGIKMAKQIRQAFTLSESNELKIRHIMGDDSSDDD